MEKKLTVKFQKLLGSPVFPPGAFVEALRFERTEGDARERRGTLFSLITLTGPKEFDAPVLGRAIFDTLEEEYFADSSLPPLSALEKAAFSAHRRLLGMTISSHLPQDVDFNLVLAVLWGQVLYLCRLGSAAVYLLRDGKVSEVNLGDESLVSCASGFVYSGDTLILGSKDFKTNFPAALVAENLLKLEEKMISLGDKATLAALVLKMEIEERPTDAESINFTAASAPPRPAQKSRAVNFGAVANALKRLSKKLAFAPGAASIKGATLRGSRRHTLVKKAAAPLVFVLIATIFVASVYFTISRQSKIKLETLTQKTFAQADLDLVSATDLVGLSDTKAAEIAEKTLKNLKALEKLKVTDPRLSQYLSRTQDLLAKVSKESPVSEPALIYDFSLIEKNIKPTNLAGTKDTLFAAGKDSGAVYSLKISAPSDTQRVDGGKINSPVEVSAFSDQVFVLTQDGVSVIKTKTKEVVSTAISSFDSLKIIDFASYNSNLYFLDSSNNQILRALYGESGYSKPSNWLKAPVSLEKASNFALNGSVYVLLSDGKVLKFEGGKLSDFSLSGYTKDLSRATYIYTGSGVDYIYLVDKDNKKIVQFDEKGVYRKTYDFNGSSVVSLSSIYVNPDSLNLYILSGTKVYEVKP